MFTFHVDLGQIIIAGLIGLVGWFVKRTVDNFDRRIEIHERTLYMMNGDIQNIKGSLGLTKRTLDTKETL